MCGKNQPATTSRVVVHELANEFEVDSGPLVDEARVEQIQVDGTRIDTLATAATTGE